MAFGADYVAEFLSILVEYLKKEQRDPHAQAAVDMSDDGATVVLEAGGRTLATSLAESVHHYVPDGLDAGRHPGWVAELFNEEAAW